MTTFRIPTEDPRSARLGLLRRAVELGQYPVEPERVAHAFLRRVESEREEIRRLCAALVAEPARRPL